MTLQPEVWGPHYWFFLQTLALSYSQTPNETLKKKYYDFFNNLPLFIPNKNISNKFVSILDKYPITPYLDSRTSLLKWIHFIHNKINHDLGKPTVLFQDALDEYYLHYKPTPEKKQYTYKKYFLFSGLILLIILVGYSNIK